MEKIESTLGLVGVLIGLYASYAIRSVYELDGPMWRYGLSIAGAALGAVTLAGGFRMIRKLLRR